MGKRNISTQNKSDGDSKHQVLKGLLRKSISGNTQSTDLSSNSTNSENPEAVANTFNIVPDFSLAPLTSLPRPSDIVTGVHQFQNYNPAHVRFISPNIKLQLASGTIDQSHFHNGIQYRPVTKFLPTVFNCPSTLNTLSNNVSGSASLPVTSNTINVKLGTSSSIQPCTIFANTGSGVAEVSTIPNIINVPQEKTGNNSLQTGIISLTSTPGVNISASEFIAPAVVINERNPSQIQSISSNVQAEQRQHLTLSKEQSQTVDSHRNNVLKAGLRHATSFAYCQRDNNQKSVLRQILHKKSVASKCSEGHLVQSPCWDHVHIASLPSSAQVKNLRPKAEVYALDKVSSSQKYHSKDSKASGYGISAEKPVSPVDTGLQQDCRKYPSGISKIKNMNSELTSESKDFKPAQTSRDASPTISSTNMIPCKSNINEEQSDSKAAIIDVESEDVEDCMLVSIDLSKQRRSIGARIHNLQVVIDSDEDELVTTSEKRDPKHGAQALENSKKPDFSCDAENLETDVTIQAYKPNSQDVMFQSSNVKCQEADSLKISRTADSVEDQSFRVGEDESVEVYIDMDIKEERPFINSDLWQSSNTEISIEGPEKSKETGTSEEFTKNGLQNVHSTPQDILSIARANFTKVITEGMKSVFASSSEILIERPEKDTGTSEEFPKNGLENVHSTPQDILSTARENFTKVITEGITNAFASSSATEVSTKVKSVSCKKRVRSPMTKKVSDNQGTVKKSVLSPVVIRNQKKLSTAASDATKADSTTTSSKAANNTKQGISPVAEHINLSPEPVVPELRDLSQNDAITSSLMCDEGVTDKETLSVEIKFKPTEKQSEIPSVTDTLSQAGNDSKAPEGYISTHSSEVESRAISEADQNNVTDSAGSTKFVCLKCKRSFSSNILLQIHLKCSPSCKSYNQRSLVQHKPIDEKSLNCIACNHISHKIDDKFDHVANSPPCFKRYAFLCISCNADVIFTCQTHRIEQTRLCRKRHLMEPQRKSGISVDQLKTKQNTGLLLMSAGVATLSCVNPSTSCTVRCEGCSSWFSSYARFKLHIHAQQACKNFYDHRNSRKAVSEAGVGQKENKSSNKPKILCPVCCKRFATNAMLTIHMNENITCRSKFLKYSSPKIAKRGKAVEKKGKSPPSSSLKPVTNDNSHPKISNKPVNENLINFNLKEMVIKLSPKSIMCSVCYKPFFDAAALSKHLVSSPLCNKQSEDINFQCQGCKKYFTGDAGLAKHIQKSFICQAKIDSTISNPTYPRAAETFASAVDLNRDLTKTQKVHVLNIDLVKSEQNKILPEVIKPHASLEKGFPVMSQISVSTADGDELYEFADEFSSEESDEDDSSSTSSDEADVEFKCKTCDETFAEKLLFKQHMMQHRRGPAQLTGLALQKIKCKACRKKLKSPKEFQAHLLKRSFCFFKFTKQLWFKKEGNVMSCKMCHKVFKNARHLGKHCFKNMTCRLCYVDAVLESFGNSSSAVCEEAHLALPKESRQGDKDLSSIQISEPLVANKEQNLNRSVLQEESLSFKCEQCHRVFDSQFKFQVHFFNEKPDCLDHYATLGPQFQAQVPYCFRCKDRFINIHKLRCHKCIGFRRYVQVCGHCNFKFPNLETLEAHAQNNENCAKALEAQIEENCGAKSFSSPQKSKEVARKTASHCSQMSQSLKSSEAQKESNLKVEKSFECVTNVGRSRQQLLSNSKPVKEFSCRVCLRKFPNIALLIEHSYEHTEEKQYDCKRCGYMCYRYNRLVSHEAVHERLDKECEHFSDRLDLHSVVVRDSGNSDYEMNRSEDESDTHDNFDHSPAKLKDSRKIVCARCGKSFESDRDLKKHLACSMPCKKKSRPQSHTDNYIGSKAMKVKQESLPVTATQPEETKENVPKLKPSVKIVRKIRSSGKSFLTATPVEEIPRGEHLFCFWCRRFLKSKEEIERHSVYKRHTVLPRKILNKAVWLPGKYACKICKATLVLKGSLIRHMVRSHKGSESVSEPVLTSDKFQESDPKKKMVASSSRIFCSLCETFITKSSKRTHFLAHLDKLKTETRASSTLPLVYSTKEQCKICQLQVKTRRGLLKHFDRHREDDIFSTSSSSSPQKLETVNLSQLSCLSKIGQRLRARNTPGRCKLCQKKFLHVTLFRQHFKLSHSNKYPKPALLYFVKSVEDLTVKKVSQLRENRKPVHGSLGKKVNSSSTQKVFLQIPNLASLLGEREFFSVTCTHLMPCKVNLGKKDKVPSKDIKVVYSIKGYENACSTLEQEISPPGSSLNCTQASSGNTLLEEMVDTTSAFNELTSPSNGVNLSVSEQVREILDQE
ncbi:hypothetical protein RRG08_001338 [Elysia crispata]|uniref:C2H2-type domain-containing protein n=2 Tax=Elysia crispata TaxID=231223 RepID=A0AAE0ZRP0_9GAST|nr:hypothetical protein RRG08_001338 [Elysia crispata]